MPINSRQKGAAFEREIANRLREFYPDAKRGFVQCRSGNEDADVIDTPWFVECKVGRRTNPHAALRQALAATDGRPVLVIAKDDRTAPCVTLLLEDFLRLLKKAC